MATPPRKSAAARPATAAGPTIAAIKPPAADRPKASGKPKTNGKPKAKAKPKTAPPKVSAMRPSDAGTLTVASPPPKPDEDQYGGLLAGLIR